MGEGDVVGDEGDVVLYFYVGVVGFGEDCLFLILWVDFGMGVGDGGVFCVVGEGDDYV